MNDFEAPRIKDTEPPRIFNTVYSRNISYNMDFVEYLIKNEIQRRYEKGLCSLMPLDVEQFRKELMSVMVIHNNPEMAINLKPRTDNTNN
jgi:hypothetical protein